jgi:hypothetical protein
LRELVRVNRNRERWNHNIHYIPLVLGAVRPGAENALDVGCLSQAVLPGRYFRRLVLWRYLVTWTKPAS